MPDVSADLDLVSRARQFASAAHRAVGQLRKYSGEPYEEHLRRVAEMVANVTDDREMIAAAWLHDVVEDTPTTVEDVERAFGQGVRDLVDALTDVSRPHHGNRAARKELDREHLSGAPARAQTVKLADLIDNCDDICRRDPRFGRTFLVEMDELLDVLRDGDSKLMQRARRVHDRWAKRLAWAPASIVAALPSLPGGATGERIRRALHYLSHAFQAADIAEPLPSPSAKSATATELPARVGDALHSVRPTQLVPLDASLADVVTALTRHDHCFATAAGEVRGYISREQMQGPVTRMWLFGIVTSVELVVTERIRAAGDTLAWTPLLTLARLEKAKALQQARAQLGRPVPLLDCLQLSDKIRIGLALDDVPRPLLRGASKAESQRLARDLEDLRNSLAHAQDIVTHDWAQIARLAKRLDELASSPSA